ncbi:ras-related protein Rab-1A-like isoform X2 [Acropora muricata]
MNIESGMNTIGGDFATLTMRVNGKTVKLQIWDTAGQEQFKAVIPSFYTGAHTIVVFYDITNQRSFQNIGSWLQEIHRCAPKNVNILLLGNKSDLDAERVVDIATAQNYAKSQGISLLETSAKNDAKVKEALNLMIADIENRVPVEPALEPGNGRYKLGPSRPVEQGGATMKKIKSFLLKLF